MNIRKGGDQQPTYGNAGFRDASTGRHISETLRTTELDQVRLINKRELNQGNKIRGGVTLDMLGGSRVCKEFVQPSLIYFIRHDVRLLSKHLHLEIHEGLQVTRRGDGSRLVPERRRNYLEPSY